MVNNFKYGKYSIVSDIAGLINNVSKSEYSETVSDASGNSSVSIREPYNKRKSSMLYVDNVNSSTFQYSFSVLNKKLEGVKFSKNLQQISFNKKYGRITFDIDSKFNPMM
nr:MAG TPA: hypothetical protein [Caudoviricetes sp.]